MREEEGGDLGDLSLDPHLLSLLPPPSTASLEQAFSRPWGTTQHPLPSYAAVPCFA